MKVNSNQAFATENPDCLLTLRLVYPQPTTVAECPVSPCLAVGADRGRQISLTPEFSSANRGRRIKPTGKPFQFRKQL